MSPPHGLATPPAARRRARPGGRCGRGARRSRTFPAGPGPFFFFYVMNLPAEAVAGLCAAGCVLASWGGVAPSSSCRWTRFALGRGGATLLSFFFFPPRGCRSVACRLGPVCTYGAVIPVDLSFLPTFLPVFPACLTSALARFFPSTYCGHTWPPATPRRGYRRRLHPWPLFLCGLFILSFLLLCVRVCVADVTVFCL